MAKYTISMYKTDYFCGGSNIGPNLIKCKDNISIPLILQSNVLHWCHTYLLHPKMDRTEAIIFPTFVSVCHYKKHLEGVKNVTIYNVYNGQIKLW